MANSTLKQTPQKHGRLPHMLLHYQKYTCFKNSKSPVTQYKGRSMQQCRSKIMPILPSIYPPCLWPPIQIEASKTIPHPKLRPFWGGGLGFPQLNQDLCPPNTPSATHPPQDSMPAVGRNAIASNPVAPWPHLASPDQRRKFLTENLVIF